MRRYLIVDMKVIFRIPVSIFFSMAYPILMMVIMMTSYGNVDIGSGYHLIDKYFLITIGMGLMPLALVSFPIWMVSSIQDNSLRRLMYFGIPFQRIMASDVLAHFIVALMSLFLNIFAGLAVYHLKIPPLPYFLAFLLQYAVALLVLMLLGSILALLIRNVQALMLVLYMFCGAFISFDQLPKSIRRIAGFLPMKNAMIDFFDIWSRKSYFNRRFLLLSLIWFLAMGVIFLIVYRMNFRQWKLKEI